MNYPGRVIKKSEKDKKIVIAVQKQINAKGCGPVDEDGDFQNGTFQAVKLFQTRYTDSQGNSLKPDGEIGPVTWEILFGETKVPVTEEAPNILLAKVLEVAQSQIGVIEDPPLSNRGKEVDEYLRNAGLNPVGQHYSWCMAFVYWCFTKAAEATGKKNPLVKTAGCLAQWNQTTCKKIPVLEAKANPSLIKPGYVFIIDHGKGMGHTGIVESVNGGFITVIEGNTNSGGSRNGFGVLRRKRKIGEISKGYIDTRK